MCDDGRAFSNIVTYPANMIEVMMGGDQIANGFARYNPLDFSNHRIGAFIARWRFDNGDEITIEATLHWCTAQRLNFEFNVFNGAGQKAASGYSVQMLTDLKGNIFFVAPDWIEEFRTKWQTDQLDNTGK